MHIGETHRLLSIWGSQHREIFFRHHTKKQAVLKVLVICHSFNILEQLPAFCDFIFTIPLYCYTSFRCLHEIYQINNVLLLKSCFVVHITAYTLYCRLIAKVTKSSMSSCYGPYGSVKDIWVFNLKDLYSLLLDRNWSENLSFVEQTHFNSLELYRSCFRLANLWFRMINHVA